MKEVRAAYDAAVPMINSSSVSAQASRVQDLVHHSHPDTILTFYSKIAELI
jgi:hypothetical protein